MRAPTRTHIQSVTFRRVALVSALLGVTGCATLRSTLGTYDVGPNGIGRAQLRLRDALVHADFPFALAFREDDALLRALNTGVTTFYASQFARSAAVLDSAALLADDRITASLSRDVLALVTSDLARPYQPRRTERLFIAYYAMLSYARVEWWEDAAVEARRLSSLLGQYSADVSLDERSTHGAMHYLAGAVFERAGERGAAQVAYRNASSLLGAPADSVLGKLASGNGELLVVVERGFVAHRTTASINVFFGSSDRDSLRDSSALHSGLPSRIAERIARGDKTGAVVYRHAQVPRVGRGKRDHDHDDDDDDDDDDTDRDGYWLSVAVPSLRRTTRPSGGDVGLAIDGFQLSSSRMNAMIDDASAADERRERVALLTRAVARAATKYALAKAVKDKKGEVAGKIVNIGASMLERADNRSWHVLPQEIRLLRVPLAPGQHIVQLTVGAGLDARRIDVGPVTVRTGALTIASTRLWSDAPPAMLAQR